MLEDWIIDRLGHLGTRLRIDAAQVQLVHAHEKSPSFQVRVHLVLPGPDVEVWGEDHTFEAAFGKVLHELESQVTKRLARPLQRRRLARSWKSRPQTHASLNRR